MTAPTILAYYVHPNDHAIWDAYEIAYDTQNRVFFAENRAPLSYFVGEFEFDRFEIAHQPNLRSADAWAQAQRNTALLDKLKRPIKPIVEEKPVETRLSVVPLPGENNLQAMQRTFAEAEAPYRADRERQRREILNQPPSEQQQKLNRAAVNASAAHFAQQARKKIGD
jgi:hypothetical protein